METQIELQFFIIIGLVTLLLLVFFIAGFLVYYHQKQLSFFQEKQELTTAFQEALLRSQLEIQEQTLKHISLEIHDNIGQTLSLAKLTLNVTDLKQPEAAHEKLMSSKNLVGKAITDLRNLARTMHAEAILASGLIRAIETQLETIRRSGIVHTAVHVSGSPTIITPHMELVLFRTVQEALNNSIKHSGGNALDIHMNFDFPFLEIIVKDNGRGFNPEKVDMSKRGSGLRNMQDRIRLIGGHFYISSQQSGTAVRMKVPIES